MTVETFLDLVWQNAKAEGKPYIRLEEREKLRELAERNLNTYVTATECLQTDAVAFTPIIGVRVYDTSKLSVVVNGISYTYLSRPMANVKGAIIDSRPLAMCGDEEGRPGASNEYLVLKSQAVPPAVSGNGKPIYFWNSAPTAVNFNVPFDSVYPHCIFSGLCLHTPFSGLDASQLLDIQGDDIAPAARLAAGELLMVYSKDAGAKLIGQARQEMKDRKGAAVTQSTGSMKRGNRARQTVNLCG